MNNAEHSLVKIYAFATVSSILLLGAVALKASAADFIKVLILAGLEITFSFDNAVVNAKILGRMSHFWQQLFMTFGILLAVFGVRVLLPIALVAVTAGLGFGKVINLALHHPNLYAVHLQSAHPMIAAFGGLFLLMVFLDFILEDRDIKWLAPLEKPLARVGKLENISIITALLTLLAISFGFVQSQERLPVVAAGAIGLLVYLAINALDAAFSYNDTVSVTAQTAATALKAGLIGFLYLELIDASFSLDGVVGAFAITDKILLIAVGLGIGALYVRSLTVHMLRRGVLAKYRYMEHGAHYAIGILAVILLATLRFNIPEFVSGISGVIFIIAAVTHSMFEMKRGARSQL